jgi:N utilization substance protein B
MGRRAKPGKQRSAARLAAVQALYQIEIAGAGVEQVIAEFTGDRLEVEGVQLAKPDGSFFAELVRAVCLSQRDLDDMIAAVLTEDWTIERLEVLLRCLLRAGAHELADRPDVPARVIISEYVDLADAFYGEKETGLVNGVLDRLARELRPAELAVPHNSGPHGSGKAGPSSAAG